MWDVIYTECTCCESTHEDDVGSGQVVPGKVGEATDQATDQAAS